MKTRISFTINWALVFTGLFLMWGGWVSLRLSGSVDAHKDILSRLVNLEDRLDIVANTAHNLTEIIVKKDAHEHN